MIKHFALLSAALAALSALPAAAQDLRVLNPGSGTPAVLPATAYAKNFD